MAKNVCNLSPTLKIGEGAEAKEVDSKMYKELETLVGKNRDLALFIYSVYMDKKVYDAMSANTALAKDEYGQHSAKDVLEFLGYTKQVLSLAVSDRRNELMEALGFTKNNNPVSIDANEAWKKAITFNKGEMQGAENVSKVYMAVPTIDANNPGKAFILLKPRDASSSESELRYIKELEFFLDFSDKFADDPAGIVSSGIINVSNAVDMLSRFQRYSSMGMAAMSTYQLAFVMSFFPNEYTNSNGVEISFPGDRYERYEAAAAMMRMIFSINRDDDANNIVQAASEIIAQFKPKIDEFLENHSEVSDDYTESLDARISALKDSLCSDSFEVRNDNQLESMSDIIDKAMHLTKEYVAMLGEDMSSIRNSMQERNELYKKREGQKRIFRNLAKTLADGSNIASFITYMKSGNSRLADMKKKMSSIKDYNVYDQASILMEAYDIISGYRMIINALKKPNVFKDINISAEQETDLNGLIYSMDAEFANQERIISEMINSWVLRLASDKTSNDEYLSAISNMLRSNMMDEDSSLFDYLYAISDVSNEYAQLVGIVINDQEDSRLAISSKFIDRLNVIEDFARKNGLNSEDTEYMITKDGKFFKGPHDYKAFYDAMKRYRESLIASDPEYLKSKRNDLATKMSEWYYNNTVPVQTNGMNVSTERVPVNAFNNQAFIDEYNSWSEAQRDLYDMVIALKQDIDKYAPEIMQRKYALPQIGISWRRTIGRMFTGKTSVRSGMLRLIDNINIFRAKKGDVDPDGKSDSVDEIEGYQQQRTYSDGTLKHEIPVYYHDKIATEIVNGEEVVNLAAQETNVLRILSKYQAAAVNYHKMQEIKDTCELLKLRLFGKEGMIDGLDVLSKVNVDPSGVKEWLRELATGKGKRRICADVARTAIYTSFRVLSDKGADSRTRSLVKRMIDYKLYDIRENGVMPRLIRGLIGYRSYTALSGNLLGQMNNYLVGQMQMMIAASGGMFYNRADLLKAMYILTSESLKNSASTIGDFFYNHKNSTIKLMLELFDPTGDMFNDYGDKDYGNPLGKLIGNLDGMGGYTKGELGLHLLNLYAVLNHEKVVSKSSNKEMSLLDAIKFKADENGVNKQIEFEELDFSNSRYDSMDELIDSVRRRIKAVNARTHGQMSDADKGLIHAYVMGSAVMNFRQWMVGTFAGRLRKRHFDRNLDMYLEGTHRTLWRVFAEMNKMSFAKGFTKDLLGFDGFENLSDQDRANLKASIADFRMIIEVASLLAMVNMMVAVDWDDDDDQLPMALGITRYLLTRLELEAENNTIIGMFSNMQTIVNAPIPAAQTLKSSMYVVTGLMDTMEILRSGPNKGWNKYLRNVLKYELPWWSKFETVKRVCDRTILQSFTSNGLSNY